MRNKQSSTQLPDKYNRAIRMMFSYEGNNIQLLSQQKVEMIAPPSDPVYEGEGETGFWYILTDADGKALYRQIVHIPIRPDVEVFSDDSDESIARSPVSNPKVIFELIVPDIDEAVWMKMFGPQNILHVDDPATEIEQFKMI